MESATKKFVLGVRLKSFKVKIEFLSFLSVSFAVYNTGLLTRNCGLGLGLFHAIISF